jgi:hypothetical protein
MVLPVSHPIPPYEGYVFWHGTENGGLARLRIRTKSPFSDAGTSGSLPDLAKSDAM